MLIYIKIIKTLFSYFFILLLTFVFLEILSRAFFHELSRNHIHKKVTENEIISKNISVFNELFDDLKIRKSNKIYNNNVNYDKVYLIGDSVSGGYGLKYIDTFFSMAEDMINYSSLSQKRFLAIGEYNNNIFDNYNIINNSIIKFTKDDYLMFQFNFNDLNFYNFRKYFTSQKSATNILENDIAPIITNLNKEDVEAISENFDDYYHERLKSNNIYKFLNVVKMKTMVLRRNYLNHSSLLRVMQHYAGILSRNTRGSCEERKLDALGQYTYTFGAIGFEKESELLWGIFESFILEMNNIAKKNNINFVLLISPISLLIDHHTHINHTNLSIECATIDARLRLVEFFKKNNIDYIDPTDIFNAFSNASFNEKNKVSLFHHYDTNHPNYSGSYLIALSILEYFKKNKINR